jgi:hypothetical protein
MRTRPYGLHNVGSYVSNTEYGTVASHFDKTLLPSVRSRLAEMPIIGPAQTPISNRFLATDDWVM